MYDPRYEEKPILWDHCYNKLKKNDAWVELANEMEIDTEECKKKLTVLLASLRREKAKVNTSKGTGKSY